MLKLDGFTHKTTGEVKATSAMCFPEFKLPSMVVPMAPPIVRLMGNWSRAADAFCNKKG